MGPPDGDQKKKKGGVIARGLAPANRALHYTNFLTRSVSEPPGGKAYLLSVLLPGGGAEPGRFVCSRSESEGPHRLFGTGQGAIDQRPGEGPDGRRVQVSPAVPRGIPEGAFRRRRAPGEGDPARQGVHGVHVPREVAVRVGGGEGPCRRVRPPRPDPTRRLGPLPPLPAPRVPPGAPGMRVRRGRGPPHVVKGGAGGCAEGVREAPSPDPDERTRILRRGSAERGARRHHHG